MYPRDKPGGDYILLDNKNQGGKECKIHHIRENIHHLGKMNRMRLAMTKVAWDHLMVEN